ncbi:hypothetical protein [Devosia sp.]|uniref:hypothetical protein n=1 Tax=Devosia sp. TaxID=1871048 RepID=UPI003BA885BA
MAQVTLEQAAALCFCFRMYTNLRDYSPVVLALRPVLDNLPGKIVAIGGGLAAGKTTLGRYLAYHFNISLIETDLFRLKNKAGRLSYRNEALADAIASRVDRQYPRPVIVESAVILRVLSDIGRPADYYIHVISDDEVDVIDSDERADVALYDAEYAPRERANLLVHFP